MSRYYRHAAPLISTSDYMSWEIKRYIESTETPGMYGYFGSDKQGGDK